MDNCDDDSTKSKEEISLFQYRDKMNRVITQKDSLIVSLKDTVTNLSNIIVNNGQNIVKINDSINSNINSTIVNNTADTAEKYIKDLHLLKVEKESLQDQLSLHKSEYDKMLSSYNILNEMYIDLINDNNKDKSIYADKIKNLLNTIDGIKILHDDRTKNIHIYYRKQLLAKNIFECQKCYKANIKKLFLPCKHAVLCENCFNNYCDSKDVCTKSCLKCNASIDEVIDINFD